MGNIFLSVNMAMSIDGKIAPTQRGPVKLGSAYDSKRMEEIRSEQDLVFNGATTFLAHPYPLHIKSKRLLRKRKLQKLFSQPISAIVSSALKLPTNTPWHKAVKAERWALCGMQTSKTAIQKWQKLGVKVLLLAGVRPQARAIHRLFREMGLKNVLLEGGGELNATFFEADLVDRIYLTIVPKLVGGSEAPTIFEGQGFAKNFPLFRLSECKKVGQELYLIYDRNR